MAEKQNMKRMKELIQILNQASKAYYDEDREIMSNFEYDKLYDELVDLEKETGITLSNSPTINVGYEVVSSLPKEKHPEPMLSLDKTKDVEVLADTEVPPRHFEQGVYPLAFALARVIACLLFLRELQFAA